MQNPYEFARFGLVTGRAKVAVEGSTLASRTGRGDGDCPTRGAAFAISRQQVNGAAHRRGMTDSTDAPQPGLPPLLDTDELASYLRTPKAIVEYWRVTGAGPVFMRIGRKVFYSEPDVLTRLETKKTSRGE